MLEVGWDARTHRLDLSSGIEIVLELTCKLREGSRPMCQGVPKKQAVQYFSLFGTAAQAGAIGRDIPQHPAVCHPTVKITV